ncbi:MAG: transglycosylase SLT domain-containing protein [Bradymonadaceae bacterium]
MEPAKTTVGAVVPGIVGAVLASLSMLPARTVAADSTDPEEGKRPPSHFRVIDRGEDGGAGEPESGRLGPTRATPGQLASPLPDPLRRAVGDQQWERAQRQLNVLVGRGLEAIPDFQFLAGYLAYRLDRHDEAVRILQHVAPRLDYLSDDARFTAGRAALEADRYRRAVSAFSRVSERSLLFPRAVLGMAEAVWKSGGEDVRGSWVAERTASIAESYLEHYPEGDRRARARLLAGRARAATGDWKRAGTHLFAAIRLEPLGETADRARSFLESHRASLPDPYPGWLDSPPMSLKMARFEAMFHDHRSEALVERLEPLVSEWTPGTRRRCRGMYWLGKSLTKLRRHGESVDWYRRIVDQCRGVGKWARKALYLGGLGYWNAGQRDRALSFFERLRSSHPRHSYADDTMYFTARIHREVGRDGRAREVLRDQVDRYPGGDMAADAHWLLVRRMFERDRYDRVVEYVRGLDETGERSRTVRGRLRYFLGRALAETGRREAAREAYRRVLRTHPLSYYALLAANRLAPDPSDAGDVLRCGSSASGGDLTCGRAEPSSAPPSPAVVPPAVRRGRHFRTGLQLLRLGLRTRAQAEFDRVLQRHEDRPAVVWSLANLYDVAGAQAAAHRLPDRLDRWRTSYPTGASTRRRWTIAYPRVFEKTVERWTERRELRSSLVYALMRRESGFDADIASWANAVGLMQLMPETARSVAERLGVSGEVERRLTDPAFNVRLGTAYLDRLAEHVGGRLPLVAAGYNGGMANLDEWIDERPDVPMDLWIEDIPYGQTRKYAKVVMADAWAYAFLYREGRIPRLSFRPPGQGGG